MKKLLTALAATSALALGAGVSLNAQDAPAEMPGQVDLSRVTAGTYATDPAHTLVEWEVSHFGFNPYVGLFGDAEGTLTIDPADIAATQLDVSVPINSLAVVSEGLRDHMLRPGEDGAEPDFFGPDAGMARFVATDVRRVTNTSALASGDLTMNGVTRPLAMLVEFTGAGTNPMSEAETIGFTGHATITRSEYGIAYAVPMVSDDVELTISAAFEKQD
ncbi:YceI family protein [Altererythrobacter sp. MTPC7]|uniref:YceI family protein n=1 Tax=Altererythrobacter sp. MTPC7 TaxID=3056567 RepID=UPI0036F447AD